MGYTTEPRPIPEKEKVTVLGLPCSRGLWDVSDRHNTNTERKSYVSPTRERPVPRQQMNHIPLRRSDMNILSYSRTNENSVDHDGADTNNILFVNRPGRHSIPPAKAPDPRDRETSIHQYPPAQHSYPRSTIPHHAIHTMSSRNWGPPRG